MTGTDQKNILQQVSRSYMQPNVIRIVEDRPFIPSHSPEDDSDESMEILTRSRKHLSKQSTAILRDFLQSHWSNPYPSPTERDELREKTGLTVTQINNW